MTDLNTLPISESLKSYAMDTRKAHILDRNNINLDGVGPDYAEMPLEAIALMRALPPAHFSDIRLELSDYTLAVAFPFSQVDVGITFWNASNEVAEDFLNYFFTVDSDGINPQFYDFQDEAYKGTGLELGQFTYIYRYLDSSYDAEVLRLIQAMKGVNLNLVNFPDYLIEQIQNTTDCTYAQVIINQFEFSPFDVYNLDSSAPLNTLYFPAQGIQIPFPPLFWYDDHSHKLYRDFVEVRAAYFSATGY